MPGQPHTVVVIGATGTQGGATARRLLRSGHRVRAFALHADPDNPAARALADAGAELFVGDLGDPSSLEPAMKGATAVFAVALGNPADDGELHNARTVLTAARDAGIDHLVQTTVAATTKREQFPGWHEGRWFTAYWESKLAVEEAAARAGFPRWTILKPVYMMDNFALPRSDFMIPTLRGGEIATPHLPGTSLQVVASADIAAYATAAFEDPDRFHGHSIELAGDAVTMDAAAAVLGDVTGRTVTARWVSSAQAVADGLHEGVALSYDWNNEHGYRAPTPTTTTARWGVPLRSFRRWALENRDVIVAG